ncbi:MAG: hypothetical protein JNK46_17575, partial [Methylobacteriaceae bacterium]|nr:hypothetical protein [Methylobacteriaceae bacterium]
SIQAGIAPAGSPAAERAAARLTQDDPLEAEGQIISGWGIGDDILRLAMLTRLEGRERAYLYHLDARLCELAGRALPAMRFAASFTRIVDEAGRRAFWAAREGVPIGLDAHRLTRERLEAMQAGLPTMQSEEILHAYLLSRGETRFPFAPIFAASPAAGARMAAKLAGLPAGRPRIALAWRSSLRGADRDVYFCAVEDLAPLFEADVTIIVAQPRLSPAERDWLAARPNAVVWDDVDFWDDFDAQAALFPALDLVVSTKLSLRDFSAACGARTLSLSLGHAHAEGARLAPDGASDRVFPTLTHLAEARYGGRAGVIAEAARRLAQLAEGGPAQG